MRASTVRQIATIGLLLTLFGLLVLSVRFKSPTTDEQNHVARGLAYLRTGDLRLSQEHPPGVNAWSAWPLLLDARVRLPLESASWANGEWYGFADLLFWRVNERPQAMAFATRVPIMWLTCILAAIVFRWAYTLGGGWAGLIALGLYVFDPNLLAHGRLTTTDMGVACGALAAMWGVWRALQGSDWRRWASAGALFGLAQFSKFSALVLGPVVLIAVGVAWVRRRRANWGGAAAFICAGALVVWAGYRFTWGPIAPLGGVPGPAPAYWSGIASILGRTGGGTPAYLMGQYGSEGWWAYFPVAFAIKTPLPTLLLLAAALALWVRGWAAGARREDLPASLCTLLPVLAFWGMALTSSFNIGYRHLLPTLPFAYVVAGWQLAAVARAAGARAPGALRGAARRAGLVRRLWGAAAVGATLLWLAAGTLAVAPHYLAYFSPIAGGPDGGYRYLVDSNLDWGQDLPGLARYVAQEGLERVYLSWFGAAHPEAYDLPVHPLPGYWRYGGEAAAYGYNPYAPAPGTYAISASNLQGVALQEHDLYAWFRTQTPVARIGHSIHIYRVEGEPAVQRVVALAVPIAQLAGAERALLEGGASLRSYDPASGIIYPLGGGAQETWFVAPPEAATGAVVRVGAGYALFQGAPSLPALSMGTAQFGEYVDLAAHEIERMEGRTLRVRVAWRVLAAPHRAAKSFAHLLDGAGRYVAGWDGVTAPATCWQGGDVIWQGYEIALPPELPPGPYAVEIGWYDAETGARWPCYVGGALAGDRYLLQDVEVAP
ncbi:MAG: glycosyltransferase family 39 protein [Anaerolineae bacterium]|nr:glycosyltransferase family 39 protein [Anaerolineae bacterium]